MSSQTYQIVFSGEIAKDCDIDIVKRNLAALFKTDLPAINRIFCGQPMVIKRNLDPEHALMYLSAITQAGAVARMEFMPMAQQASVAIEHRNAVRRLTTQRRQRLRDESFVPDRRERLDRRHPVDSPK
ncbi:MAG: hypothetical protein HY942_02315 [Gammaproteobacteria bacterium]|nr:hypothetical protein [Gammaproteobacteria bacterium]